MLRNRIRELPAHGGTGFSSLPLQIYRQQKKSSSFSEELFLLISDPRLPLEDKLRDFLAHSGTGFFVSPFTKTIAHKKSPSSSE